MAKWYYQPGYHPQTKDEDHALVHPELRRHFLVLPTLLHLETAAEIDLQIKQLT